MATPTAELLQVAQFIQQHLRIRQSLRTLGARTGMSPFRLQREFTRLAGESPASYARRIRLVRAATELLRTDAPLMHIARQSGFASTEVLIRNFRALFGSTPAQFRRNGRSWRADPRFINGLRRLARQSPCHTLYHAATKPRSTVAMPMLSTDIRTLQPQHALIIRSRITRDEIADTIGKSLGRIVPHVLGAGGALAGQPFARYPDYGPGMITIEVGMPLHAPLAGTDDIEPFTLPAGLTAIAVHGGPYHAIAETFAEFEKWIVAQGRVPAGPPWEVYVTDPGELPDPNDWRTEIYWPVR